MRTIVTGGCGFIGTHTVREFLRQGSSVLAFDNLSRRGTEKNLEELAPLNGFEFARGAVQDATLQTVIRSYQPDLIIHLAGQVAVTTSIDAPLDDFESNASGTLNLLEGVRHLATPPAVFYSSTNKVYGDLGSLRLEVGDRAVSGPAGWSGVDETARLDFYSPYGCSKGSADQYVHDYARIYGLNTVVFRQSCIYGPGQFGVEDQGWVAWFAIAGLARKPVTIYGDGKQVRDLLHVSDLVDAYVGAWQSRDACSGEIYNIGGGLSNALSLLEYIDLLAELGVSLSTEFGPARPGDQRIFVADNRKIGTHLDWSPKIEHRIGLSEMVADLDDRIARGIITP